MFTRTRTARTFLALAIALVVATVAVGFGTRATEAAPVVDTGGPYTGIAGQAIQFNAAATLNGSTYTWSFGDGTSASGVAPLKVYDAAGVYTVTLTVTDIYGTSASATTTATIVSWFGLTNPWYPSYFNPLYPAPLTSLQAGPTWITVPTCPNRSIVIVDGVPTCTVPNVQMPAAQ